MTTNRTTRGALTLEAGVDKKHLGASMMITNATPMTQREFRAAVLRLAAEIEEASEGERWLVHVERGEAYGAPGRETRTARIWIEAVTGSEEEEQRALATLVAVVTR
ncbi:MAG: hypothetical protein IPN34_16985 [Planctomycetes bacterium]|jgi:hypothetical protein|nr:hypothetical protein [Planctomycetota bacterium]